MANPKTGKAFNLRARLFQSHYDLKEEETANFTDPRIWRMLLNNARNNTLIYREVFGCLPDDTVTEGSEAEGL